jgi:hypothetical protein
MLLNLIALLTGVIEVVQIARVSRVRCTDIRIAEFEAAQIVHHTVVLTAERERAETVAAQADESLAAELGIFIE